MARPWRQFVVGLSDEYHLPIHELLDRWTGREITEVMVWRKFKQQREQEAIKEAQKPKAQTPEDILAVIDSFA